MDWARYWRSADSPLEAMYAHFERHTYHRHSHETYSFGVTESGAQSFTCRGGSYTSAAGMVMAFNPDDPHDGHAAGSLGFTYRMVHIGPSLVSSVLADAAGRSIGLPLFTAPVVHDAHLASAVRGVHQALLGDAHVLVRDERLMHAVRALVRQGVPASPSVGLAASARVREVLESGVPVTADDLAAVAGASRFAVYRSFRAAYGMSPSDYQRQVRLREARRLLVAGAPIAEVAARTGFADQSHLTRWFTRYFGITPGVYVGSLSF